MKIVIDIDGVLCDEESTDMAERKPYAHRIQKLNQMYADHTGQPIEKINDAMERDKFMSPEEALEFGLIDKIISTRADVETN